MKQFVFLGVFFLLVSLIHAQYNANFVATFRQSKVGLLGFLTGKVYYSETNKAIRYDYDPLDSYYEIFRYDTSSSNELFVYKACTGQCDIVPQPTNVKQPIFNYRTADTCETTTTNALYGTCFKCVPADGSVKSYCINTMAEKKPIQVVLKDDSVIDLKDHVPDGAAATKSTFDPFPSWGCQLNCGLTADIVLIIDESGSISDSEWIKVREFAVKLVNGFTIAPDKVNMGLVFFSTGARIQLPVISDQNAYRTAIASLTRQNYGTTWIGAGTIYGAKLLRGAPRTVPKIGILLTDGVENAPNPFNFDGKSWVNRLPTLEWLTNFNSAPTNGILVTIGVGSDSEINPTYLTTIASTSVTSGNKMFFRATSFDNLVSDQLIKDITRSVCTASNTPSSPCPSCAGLCTCGTCVCPSSCDDFNPCTIDTCTPTKNNRSGCIFEPKNCDDSNACTVDTCDPKLPNGCTSSPKVCNDNNVCTTDTCDPKVGCIFKPIKCDDGNACTSDSCDPLTGCKNTNITCDDKIPCTVDSCDKVVGCVAKLRDKASCFDSKDPCSVRDCDKNTGNCVIIDNLCSTDNPCTFNNGTPNVFYPIDCTGGNKCISPDCNRNSSLANGCYNTSINCDDASACTDDSCDKATGCVNAPKNCDDKDACTLDTCNKTTGCMHTNISCNDNNECTEDSCDKATGCKNTPKVCNDSNACTIDSCDSTIGCVYTPLDIPVACNDGSVCTTDTCDPATGCKNVDIVCDPNSNGNGSSNANGNATNNPAADNSTKIPCHVTYECEKVRGCERIEKCNTTVDIVPACSIQKCDGSESSCNTVKNEIDACTIIAATAGAVLGAAAIAGIIIAAVLLTGGAAAGAYYGYNKLYKGEFENKNPLYEAETKVGQNQLYAGK